MSRNVALGRGGELLNLSTFQLRLAEQQKQYARHRLMHKAASRIQGLFRYFNASVALSSLIACASFTKPIEASSLIHICLLSTYVPEALLWRSAHSHKSSRVTSICYKLTAGRKATPQDNLATLLSKGKYVSKPQIRIVHDPDVLNWLRLREKNPRPLPPVWKCLVYDCVKLIDVDFERICGHFSTQNLLKFCAIVAKSVESWQKISDSECDLCIQFDYLLSIIRTMAINLLSKRENIPIPVQWFTTIGNVVSEAYVLLALTNSDKKALVLEKLAEMNPDFWKSFLVALSNALMYKDELLRGAAHLLECTLTYPSCEDTLNITWTLQCSKGINSNIAKCLMRLVACIADAQARLPKKLRIAHNIGIVVRSILHRPWEPDERDELLDVVRKESVASLIMLQEGFAKYTTIFTPTRIEDFFLKANRRISEKPKINIANISDRIALEFLQAMDTTDEDYYEVTTFNNPVDMALFDHFTNDGSVLKDIMTTIGNTLFECEPPSITRYVDSMGKSPNFLSQTALVHRVLISYVLRRSVILDDKSFCQKIDHENVKDYKRVWYSITSFPLTSTQMELFTKFVNHTAYLLLNYLNEYMVKEDLVVNTKCASSPFSHIALDAAKLARLLVRRCARLNLSQEMGFIADVSHSANVWTPRIHITDDLFDSVTYHNPSIISANSLVLGELPHAIPFNPRVNFLRKILSLHRKMYTTGVQTTSVLIRRSRVLEDTLLNMVYFKRLGFAPLKIKFVDNFGITEEGVDGGGLTREWMMLVAQELADVRYGFLKASSVGLLPNPVVNYISVDYSPKLCYELCGYVAGRAIYESIVLSSFEFNPLFLNRVLGNVNTLDDLRTTDEEIHSNILKVRDYDGDVSELSLSFTATIGGSGVVQEVSLIPDGANKSVTGENRAYYCLLLSNLLGNKLLDDAAKSFVEGLSYVIDEHWLKMFNAAELTILIAGKRRAGFDIDDLREHTIYTSPFNESHQTIQFFWEIMEKMSLEQQTKFLKFIFAVDRAPLTGFANLVPKFAITPTFDADLPSAATCVNLLRLPLNVTKADLEHRIETAINNTNTFDLA